LDPDPAPNWNIKAVLNAAMNDLVQEQPSTTDNSYKPLVHFNLPQQHFDHSIPVIRTNGPFQRPQPQVLQPSHYVIQLDGGANRSITNNAGLLIAFKNIKRYAMAGINGSDPALYCIGKGLLPWTAESGETLYISCYYSNQASETLISPTDVVLNHIGIYKAWGQHADIDTGTGAITFYHRNGFSHARYPLYMRNGLWFYSPNRKEQGSYPLNAEINPVIRRLTSMMLYILMHERLCHPGKRVMSIIHLHFTDMPKLTSGSCSATSLRRRETERRQLETAPRIAQETTDLQAYHVFDDDPTESTHIVTNAEQLPDYIQKRLESMPVADCRYHMDFGFPRGSSFQGTDVDTGHTYTSIDGYRAYLIIILFPQRRIWIFLVKNK
jgi:hypothetical protein